MDLHSALRALTAAAFLLYGVLCLVSPAMAAEFERYRLPRLRVLTALLEIAGALGLLLAPNLLWQAAAALGLCAMMVAALLVRARIRDPWHAMLSAGLLLVANAWLASRALAS